MSKFSFIRNFSLFFSLGLLAAPTAQAVNINDDSFQFGTKSEIPANINKEMQPVDMPTPETQSTLVFGDGHENNDKAVNDRVKSAVMDDSALAGQLNKFDSETKDGAVTIKGSVPSDSVKAQLLEKVKAVDGVKSVVDQVEVSK